MKQYDKQAWTWRSTLRVCLLGLALAAASVAHSHANAASPDPASESQGVVTGRSPLVNIKTYNFTPYGVAFLIGDAVQGSAHPNAATGSSSSITPLRRVPAGTPVDVRWRYTNGPNATPRDDYPFRATLREPSRPYGDVSLTVRFFPEGKVAMRYTLKPEISDFENVPAALPGNGWESNL